MARPIRNQAGGAANISNLATSSTAQLAVPSRASRVSVSLRNNSAADIFIGKDGSLTVGNGYPLHPDEEYEFTEYLGPIFAVSTSAGDLRFIEVY